VSAVAESLADVFVREARYDDALSCLDLAARTSGPQPATRARLLRKRGELHERVGRYATALACFARGRRELAGQLSGEEAWLDIATAGVKYRQGRHRDMARWARSAIEAARKGDEELAEGHANALLVLASVYGAASDPERLGEEALAIFERHDDALRAAKVVNNLGMHAYYTGAWGVAQERWRTCAEYFAKAGDVDGTAIAHNNVGEVLSDQGRLAEAEQALGRGHQIWAAAHYPLGTALGLSNLGRLAARQGSVDEALEMTQRAADMFRDLGAPAYALEALARHAEANLLAGHADEAFREATETLGSEHHASAHDSTIVLLERCLAWSLLQLGNPDAARQHARRAVERAESSNNPYELALSIQAESAVAQALGIDPEDAPDRADSILRGLGVTFVPQVPLTRL
jgi:tetratricopeptide (TPR) repeat protein